MAKAELYDAQGNFVRIVDVGDGDIYQSPPWAPNPPYDLGPPIGPPATIDDQERVAQGQKAMPRLQPRTTVSFADGTSNALEDTETGVAILEAAAPTQKSNTLKWILLALAVLLIWYAGRKKKR